MAKSTNSVADRKVRLSIHKASGLWCKTHRGKRYYFEKVDSDPEGKASFDQWLQVLAGNEPKHDALVSVKDIAEEWMQHKRSRLESGELSQDTYDEYFKVCEMVFKAFGKNSDATMLQPADFRKLRSQLAKRFGPVALGKHVGQIRSLFNFAYESGVLQVPAKFGPDFVKPSAKVLRKQRAQRGKQDFDAPEIKQLLSVASPNWKAMILLGTQAGFGNRDVAELSFDVVDLETGWIDYPREKTGVPRRVPLWPETIDAIRDVISKHPIGSGRLFVGHRGRDYCTENRTGGNRITGAFKPVLKKAGFSETGRGFYCFRRTFQTQAEECGDLVAVKAIMGHAAPENDMSARYRQRISDNRLRRTVDTVRAWLYGKGAQHETR